jgi:iron-sulfur cluster repair protein YtfE (RIC family)
MNADFSGPLAFFTEDHRHCDELWAELEANPDLARWTAFDRAMRQHFAMEEEVLFPAIEQATGMTGGGPIFVMRTEHAQMKAILDNMRIAAEAGDFGAVLDQGDSLLMVIQQHNVKEESVLYPMADHTLGGQWAAMTDKLQAYRTA